MSLFVFLDALLLDRLSGAENRKKRKMKLRKEKDLTNKMSFGQGAPNPFLPPCTLNQSYATALCQKCLLGQAYLNTIFYIVIISRSKVENNRSFFCTCGARAKELALTPWANEIGACPCLDEHID